jgi:hypothetical protein
MTEKIKIMRLLVFTVLLSLLAACGQKGEVTKTEFVIAGIEGASADTINGALMITAYNPNTNQVIRKKMGTSAQNLTLPNGRWYFSALYWDQSALEGATLRCALAREELSGSEISINLALTRDNCETADFNKSTFLDAGNLQQIKVNQCSVFGALADNCANAPGSAQSFEIVFRSFNLSPLDTPALDPLAGVIKSACIDTAGWGEIESYTLIPSGSTDAPIPFTIRTFSAQGCDGASTSFNFNVGLLSADSATSRIYDFQASAVPDVTRILVINPVTPQAPLLD